MTVGKDAAEPGGTPGAGEVRAGGTALRVVVGGAGAAVVLAVFGALAPTDEVRPGIALRALIWVASGLLYVGVMAPVARRARGGRWSRFLTVLLPLYVTGTVGDLVEGYFYTTELSAGLLVAAMIFELVPISLIALIVVVAVPPQQADPGDAGPHAALRERTAASWAWRVLAAGVPYAAIYEFFATLVTPIEHAYYNDPAFIASLHTRIPPWWVTLLLEAGRGVLFVLAALPVLLLFRRSRTVAVLQVAAIGAVVEAYVPLLGRTTWPAGMRLGNVLELTCDATARAALMVALVGLPAVATLSGRAPDRARDARVPSQELDAAPPSGTS